MDELLSSVGYNFNSLKRRQKVRAKLIEKTNKAAIFSVGGKGNGIVNEAYFAEARSLIKTLKKGDVVDAIVMDPETPEGYALLSLRHATSNMLWTKLEGLKAKDEPIVVTGVSSSERGILVEFDSITAFIPNSQIGDQALDDIDSLVGRKFEAKIIELDKSRNRVVLSERAITEAANVEKITKALKEIKEGDVLEGVVTTLALFGVFVEVKVPSGKKQVKVEGLVHVSEISWGKVVNPANVYKEGDKVKVVVIGAREGRLALSIKQATKDPWDGVGKKYKADDKVKGKVVRVSDFGVFVELEPGVEGLVHITKIPPGTKFEKGKEISCYIEDVSEKDRKIGLGLILTASKPIGYK